MNIEVVRVSEGELKRERWRFYATTGPASDIIVYLDDYFRDERKSKRHHFAAGYANSYRRLDHREAGLTINDVPRPADVEAEVRAEIVCRIRVIIQDGRGTTAPFCPPPAPLTED